MSEAAAETSGSPAAQGEGKKRKRREVILISVAGVSLVALFLLLRGKGGAVTDPNAGAAGAAGGYTYPYPDPQTALDSSGNTSLDSLFTQNEEILKLLSGGSPAASSGAQTGVGTVKPPAHTLYGFHRTLHPQSVRTFDPAPTAAARAFPHVRTTPTPRRPASARQVRPTPRLGPMIRPR